MPPAKVRRTYRFEESAIGDMRAFRLARREGGRATTRLLFLHGGAYTFDLAPTHWPVLTALVDRMATEVVAPIYPLAPENDVEAGLAATLASYMALVDEVGAGNVAVCGDSAGGGLALALAQRLRNDGLPPPAALALFFPWLDVAVSGADQPALARRDRLLNIETLRECGRLWAGAADPSSHPASPLFADMAGLPPMLVATGTHDLLLSDTRRLAERHREAIVREYPGMFHGFVCAPIPEAARSLDETAAFMIQHLKASQGRDQPGAA